MKINDLSFITPTEYLTDKKVVLEKSYSKQYSLSTGESLSICSNKGNRLNQEDCIVVTKKGNYLLLLVADGMGGMEYGELASYTTAKIIKQWLETEDENSLKLLDKKNLEDVLNALMYLISTNIPVYSGSTLNMSIIGPKETIIANVGDSRTYTIKDGIISLRTKDDSYVFNKYKPNTEKDRDKLRFHKNNNIIINSITKNTFPTIRITSINNDDYDILCHLTDGITDYLQESLISYYSQYENPAIELVNNSIKGLPIYSNILDSEYKKEIYPGEDNATAIVYTKKK